MGTKSLPSPKIEELLHFKATFCGHRTLANDSTIFFHFNTAAWTVPHNLDYQPAAALNGAGNRLGQGKQNARLCKNAVIMRPYAHYSFL